MRRATATRVIKDLGRRLAELRRDRGMTQEALAERLDVTVGYVRRLEAGTNMTVESMLAVAGVLGVTIPDLFTPPASRDVRRGRPPRRKDQ